MITRFGIRHHGPGCARSLEKALDALRPDLLLVELPSDLGPHLPALALPGMVPPVALMVYPVDRPDHSSFYPFAEFSPEWRAFQWAVKHQVPFRGMDLPAAHRPGLREEQEPASGIAPAPDPFELFAAADGFSDGERWWNDRVEERGDDASLFEAINEAVTALRGELQLPESRLTLLREAWMRKSIRAAESEGHANIAVVCGAWHLPALQEKTTAAKDNALLKGLPRTVMAAAWIPWTHARLTLESGYGAGVRAPGWYAHLWKCPRDPIPTWLTSSARFLRLEGMDASSASVIEAVRLSGALAGLRGRPQAGLDECLEAIRTVFCMGDGRPLDLLRGKWLVGEVMGSLPPGLPRLPLQEDIESQARSLRLKLGAAREALELDLREEGGRLRSVFLHRLQSIQVEWAGKQTVRGKGTFKEVWRLQWKPEHEIAIISAAPFGNTLETAAREFLLSQLPPDAPLSRIAEVLDLAVFAQLPEAVDRLLARLDDAAAAAADVLELLDAAGPLARTARYGDVRKSSAGDLARVVAGFAVRIHAGLPGAVCGIQEEAAGRIASSVVEYGAALGLLNDRELVAAFHEVLGKIMRGTAAHALLRGRATRLLHDAQAIPPGEVARQFSFALSAGMPPLAAGGWLEGFLGGAGSLLLHDHELLAQVDQWVTRLDGGTFQAILPVLRRTFGGFTAPERARIAAAVQQPGAPGAATGVIDHDLDLERAIPAAVAAGKIFAGTFP